MAEITHLVQQIAFEIHKIVSTSLYRSTIKIYSIAKGIIVRFIGAYFYVKLQIHPSKIQLIFQCPIIFSVSVFVWIWHELPANLYNVMSLMHHNYRTPWNVSYIAGNTVNSNVHLLQRKSHIHFDFIMWWLKWFERISKRLL